MTDTAPPPARAGRPVDPARRRAVLEAVGELLREQPYDAVTIEQIAGRAGVGKQLIYRVWGSKAEVVAQAVLQGTFSLAPHPVPDTGDLRADLENWLRGVAAEIASPAGRSIARALATASAGGPDRRELFDQVLTRRAGSVVVERLRSARGPDAPAPAVPDEVVADLLTGYITLATLVSAPLDAERLGHVVGAVLPREG